MSLYSYLKEINENYINKNINKKYILDGEQLCNCCNKILYAKKNHGFTLFINILTNNLYCNECTDNQLRKYDNIQNDHDIKQLYNINIRDYDVSVENFKLIIKDFQNKFLKSFGNFIYRSCEYKFFKHGIPEDQKFTCYKCDTLLNNKYIILNNTKYNMYCIECFKKYNYNKTHDIKIHIINNNIIYEDIDLLSDEKYKNIDKKHITAIDLLLLCNI